MPGETIDDNNSYTAGIEPIVIQGKSEGDATFITTTQEQLPPPQHQSVLVFPMSDYSVPPELQIPLIVLVRWNHFLPVWCLTETFDVTFVVFLQIYTFVVSPLLRKTSGTPQIALVGFVVILVLSSVSVPKPKRVTPSKKDEDDDDNNVPGTPSRKSTRSSTEVTGSIVTPMGRRSARLRAKHD